MCIHVCMVILNNAICFTIVSKSQVALDLTDLSHWSEISDNWQSNLFRVVTPVTLVGLLYNFQIHSYEMNISFVYTEINTVFTKFVIDSQHMHIHDGVLSTILILMFRSLSELWNRSVWFGFIANVLDNLYIGLCVLTLSKIKQCRQW